MSGGIRARNPNKRAAADPRLRPRGLWERLRRVSCAYEIWRITKFKIDSIEERWQGVKELPDLSTVAETRSNKLYI
jgi:hypothetical protein